MFSLFLTLALEQRYYDELLDTAMFYMVKSALAKVIVFACTQNDEGLDLSHTLHG
jgi:hypothetical protein